MDKQLKIILSVAGILAIIVTASILGVIIYIGSGYYIAGVCVLTLLLSSAALAVTLFIAAFKVKNTMLRIVMIIVALIVAFIAVSIFIAATTVVCDPVHPPNGGPVVCDPVHQPVS